MTKLRERYLNVALPDVPHPLSLQTQTVTKMEQRAAAAARIVHSTELTTPPALHKDFIDVAMLEQRRIGQELHDGTQQELMGLKLLAMSLAESLSRNNAMAASQVACRVALLRASCAMRYKRVHSLSLSSSTGAG